MILTNNLLPEERRQVWEQARIHADEVHQTNAAHTHTHTPIGVEAVPKRDPHWECNTPGDILAKDWFVTCLLTGICKTARKPVNYDKLLALIQYKNENPSQFLECLTKAFFQYSNLYPETPESKQLLLTHFSSQSFCDIKFKPKHLEKGL